MLAKTIPIALTLIVLAGCGPTQGTNVGDNLCAEGCKTMVLKHLETSAVRISDGPGNGLCRQRSNRAPRFTPQPPSVVVEIKDTNTPDKNQTDAFGPYLSARADRWQWGRDEAAGRQAVDFIYNWAAADALSRTIKDGRDNSRSSDGWWTTYGVMNAAMNALFQLDDHPGLTAEKRAVIWTWLDRLIEDSWVLTQLPQGGAGFEDVEQRVNNHNVRRATALLYYGIHKEDVGLIQKSVKDIQRSFDAMDDAGVPYDANRGNWALNYISNALDGMAMHMSFMEIIAPGYLARNPEQHRQIEEGTIFAFQEFRDPSRIHEYAKANVGRGGGTYSGRQEPWAFTSTFSGLTWWGWVDSTAVRTLPEARSAVQSAMGSRASLSRAKYTEIGGNVTCWFY